MSFGQKIFEIDAQEQKNSKWQFSKSMYSMVLNKRAARLFIF